MRPAILSGCLFLLACDSESSRVEARSVEPTAIQVGRWALTVPAGWPILTGSDERTARAQVESGVRDMLARFPKGSTSSVFGIKDFQAARIDGDAGLLLVYSMQIPDQENYLDVMEGEQDEKIEWGKSQGIVTRLIRRDRLEIGGTEMLRVETEMRGGARSIGLYAWTPDRPGLVENLSVIVNPGRYADCETSVEAVIQSIRVKGAESR